VVFGKKPARQVHAGAGDVGVDIDPAGHDDHAGGVDRGGARGQVGDDPPAVRADIADIACDSVRRVVHLPTGDSQLRQSA
jgi:hypothetical protein